MSMFVLLQIKTNLFMFLDFHVVNICLLFMYVSASTYTVGQIYTFYSISGSLDMTIVLTCYLLLSLIDFF